MKDFVNYIESGGVFVSIIVPVYNTEKYLGRCLESLICQTLHNVEIIVVNDGSTDNSLEVIKKFLSDKRVILIDTPNKGQGAARNRGLEAAKGEYIGFVDSDDYVDNDFFQKLYSSAKRNGGDIAAASIVRKHETYEKWRVCYDRTSVITDKTKKVRAVKYPDQSYVWNKIYKKTFLDKINFRFEEGAFFEDVLAMAEILSAQGKLVLVPDTNYYYMVNDGNSTVKGKKSAKKELDRYNNQKRAIKIMIKEGIKLPRGEYFIKKREIRPLNIPLFKIKEDLLKSRELFLLFNLIPVFYPSQKFLFNFKMFFGRLFSISKIDGHFLIFLFFIKLNIKYKTCVKIPVVTVSGLNRTPGNKKIIASLTTFPDRINTVSTTLKTILNQTVKPDEVVLWLAEEQFPDKKLPPELLSLEEVNIKWTNDIKSYKKLIPALKEYPNDVIITFDDDIYYENDTIEALYNSYTKFPNEIQANRIWRVELKDGRPVPLNSYVLHKNWREYKEASFFNTIIGSGGVLYPPNSLCVDVLDEEKFGKILPTQDDIWFWAMALLAGTKIRLNKGYSFDQITVENTQNSGLCKLNNKASRGLSGKDGFAKIAEFYPELIKILEKSV